MYLIKVTLVLLLSRIMEDQRLVKEKEKETKYER